jgi:hypothetical protein
MYTQRCPPDAADDLTNMLTPLMTAVLTLTRAIPPLNTEPTMNRHLIVRVSYSPETFESHPLVAYLADAEDGKQAGPTVNHRDMRQVRTYYNGWLAALSDTGYALGEGYVNLHMIGWPLHRRLFLLPVNFEYHIAEAVPAELRFDDE